MDYQYSIIGSCKLSYNDFSTKCLPCGVSLPPATNATHKGKTGLHSDTMWYDREYIACPSREIGVLCAHFVLLVLLVSDIWYQKSSANLHRVGVVIVKIQINLPPVLT